MEEIVNYIKNSTDDKIKKMIYVLLFNTIYNKYPTPNTILLINSLYQDEYVKDINIFNIINYEKLMPLIKKNNNDILYGYLMLLHEHYEKTNIINELIKMFNKYKFGIKEDLTIETLNQYVKLSVK
jgi:hypothetical protein